MTRVMVSVLMAVMLVATSIGAASARGAAPVADSIVICSGHGVELVYLDADGNETRAPHLCPDCLMHLAGLPSGVAVLALPADAAGAHLRPGYAAQLHVSLRHGPSARAPPAVV
ncbi:MAG: hypothetical protein AAF601_04110 [Pseudomonadota bacterium]